MSMPTGGCAASGRHSPITLELMAIHSEMMRAGWIFFSFPALLLPPGRTCPVPCCMLCPGPDARLVGDACPAMGSCFSSTDSDWMGSAVCSLDMSGEAVCGDCVIGVEEDGQ